MEVSREAEENANKHERVLEEAFSNLLVQSGTHTKVRLISSERAETIFRRDLLAFYSRQMREIIVSLSKTVTCSPDSDLVVHMPDFSILTIIKLRSLLEEGFVRGQSSEGEIREVLEAAVCLGVDISQLNLAGQSFYLGEVDGAEENLWIEEGLLDDVEVEAGPSSESVCNYSLKCEHCKVEVKSDSQLEQHMCRHFMEELKVEVEQFIDSAANPVGFTCKKCGKDYKTKKV